MLLREFALFAVLGAVLLPLTGNARQVTLEASSSLELVNPQDASDIVRLYKFELPGYFSDMVIVRAKLEVSGLGDDDVPLKLEALQTAFSAQTNWNAFNQARAQVTPGETALVEAATSGDTAANMTRILRGWVNGENSNFGIAIVGLPASGTDSGDALDDLTEPPLLHIVYTQNTED